jgi:hypothetical protein
METTFHDIYDFELSLPWTEHPLIIGSLIGILVLVILLGTYVWYRKRKMQQRPSFYPTLFMQLEKLAQVSNPHNDELKEMYAFLMRSFKEHVQRSLKWNLDALTEHETINFLERQNIDSALKQNMIALCIRAHDVKFSNALSESKFLAEDSNNLKNFIEHTLPSSPKVST